MRVKSGMLFLNVSDRQRHFSGDAADRGLDAYDCAGMNACLCALWLRLMCQCLSESGGDEK